MILNLISCSQTFRQTQFLILAYYGSKHCRVRLLTAWWASSARNWTAWARTVRRLDNCWIAVFRARLPHSCARTPSPKTIQIGKNIINYNIIYYIWLWYQCPSSCHTLTMSCISDTLKFQSNRSASFSNTSFRLPFGQYSVRMSTVGQWMHAPMKRTVFSCVTSRTYISYLYTRNSSDNILHCNIIRSWNDILDFSIL